jgi:hypothetical protein
MNVKYRVTLETSERVELVAMVRITGRIFSSSGIPTAAKISPGSIH